MGRAGLLALLGLVLACGDDAGGGQETGTTNTATGSSSGGTTTGASSAGATGTTGAGSTGGSVGTGGPTDTASTSSGGSSGGGTGGTGGVRGDPVVYVGSDDDLIFVFDLDLATGAMTQLEMVDAGPNPTFLAVAPAGGHLFAANETGNWNGTGNGAVASFAIDPSDGTLTFVDREPSGGPGPAHVSTDRLGAWVVAANYGGATVATLQINGDGSLEAPLEVKDHGAGNHPHLSIPSLDNGYYFVPDLGRDQVVQYVFDAQAGTLGANAPPAVDTMNGDGPRHMDFHPSADWAFVVNELSDSVTTYAYAPATGLLTVSSSVSTLPANVPGDGNTCADIHVAPSGSHVYASNRGHDSIAVFSVDPGTGVLTPVEHEATGGQRPRNFEIDPAGELLLVANRDSDLVVAFAIDPVNGELTPTGESTSVPSPAFVGIHRLTP